MFTILLILLIPLIMIFISYLVSLKLIDSSNESSPFECGFDSVPNSTPPSPRFFYIMIVFLVFDLEITLILPLFTGGASLVSSWLDLASLVMLTLVITTLVEWDSSILEWNL